MSFHGIYLTPLGKKKRKHTKSISISGILCTMFLFIDKPSGITSHDVVDRIRVITGERRVGHGGTLDPLASGLLVIGVGRSSTKRLSNYALKKTKIYQATICLGEERDTDDIEGIVIAKAKGVLPPTRAEVSRIVLSFIGEHKQVPPQYSAIRIQGERAYRIARTGGHIVFKPRLVKIFNIKIQGYRYPFLDIEAKVSSGTYVRALARDIGKKLGMGAYLQQLRRTWIGKDSVEKAVPLYTLTEKNWQSFAV